MLHFLQIHSSVRHSAGTIAVAGCFTVAIPNPTRSSRGVAATPRPERAKRHRLPFEEQPSPSYAMIRRHVARNRAALWRFLNDRAPRRPGAVPMESVWRRIRTPGTPLASQCMAPNRSQKHRAPRQHRGKFGNSVFLFRQSSNPDQSRLARR